MLEREGGGSVSPEGMGTGGGRSEVLQSLDPEAQRELDVLARKRLRIGLILTAVMLVVYFGFILLIAFDKDGLANRVTDGLSIGMLLGVIVVVVTWIVVWTYVGWANRRYEPEVQRLRKLRR